ncbi:MAG: hypothetical protein IJL02_02315 [Methanobrevibacter sp.]|uniref:hypothetical protein n=1 Tax=Methanobrevibacter sp. TaxID=66852 RepID=UPI0025F9D876|nr:hypothetical protein [Methanobrevibacter sp.]MBQ6098680.1 hypothetical protein [Methanobrevibacter sp.]
MTDKIEFVPDKDLERALNFNLRATGYVFNKTLEYSIYHENLVKEFNIGNQFKVNRSYTQKIIKHLIKRKPFLKKACDDMNQEEYIQKAYENIRRFD